MNWILFLILLTPVFTQVEHPWFDIQALLASDRERLKQSVLEDADLFLRSPSDYMEESLWIQSRFTSDPVRSSIHQTLILGLHLQDKQLSRILYNKFKNPLIPNEEFKKIQAYLPYFLWQFQARPALSRMIDSKDLSIYVQGEFPWNAPVESLKKVPGFRGLLGELFSCRTEECFDFILDLAKQSQGMSDYWQVFLRSFVSRKAWLVRNWKEEEFFDLLMNQKGYFSRILQLVAIHQKLVHFEPDLSSKEFLLDDNTHRAIQSLGIGDQFSFKIEKRLKFHQFRIKPGIKFFGLADTLFDKPSVYISELITRKQYYQVTKKSPWNSCKDASVSNEKYLKIEAANCVNYEQMREFTHWVNKDMESGLLRLPSAGEIGRFFDLGKLLGKSKAPNCTEWTGESFSKSDQDSAYRLVLDEKTRRLSQRSDLQKMSTCFRLVLTHSTFQQ